MAKVDCFGNQWVYAGKQTPKGPNYNVHDKFLYSKGPEFKMGTQPRNTLDTKAKYEHYFRKDIDVLLVSLSSISMKPIKFAEIILEIPGLEEPQGFQSTRRSIRWLLAQSMIPQSSQKPWLLLSSVFMLGELSRVLTLLFCSFLLQKSSALVPTTLRTARTLVKSKTCPIGPSPRVLGTPVTKIDGNLTKPTIQLLRSETRLDHKSRQSLTSAWGKKPGVKTRQGSLQLTWNTSPCKLE